MDEIPQKQIPNELASVLAIRHDDEAGFPFYRRHGVRVKPLIISPMVDNACLLYLPPQSP